MIDYNFQGRLQYIPGGAMHVQMSAWPSVLGANWWEPTTGSFTCVAAYQAKGAASLAASYVNLANPGTNDAAPGSAPTFDTSYGWDFNGSSNYLTTGIIPTVSYSALVRFSDGGTGDEYLLGTFNASDSKIFGLRPTNPGAARNHFNAGDLFVSGGRITSGVMGLAGKTGYLNGVSCGTIGAGTSTWDAGIYIGARNNDGFAVGGYCSAKIQAIAIYSTTLDATQVGEITANMNAL
jgi:hypothetical protein